MSSTTQSTKTERQDAIERLRLLLPPGSTVYTILRHVSRSGMSRSISCVICGTDGPQDIDWLVRRALDARYDRKHSGIVVGGCGMDMGFHLVYSLSYTLYPKGFGCVGARCPSNDHANGDRDYTPHGLYDENGEQEDRDPFIGEEQDGCKRHWHQDGGYAISQRWL